MDPDQAERLIAAVTAIADGHETTNHWLREMIGLLEPIGIFMERIDDKLERIANQG